MNLFSWWCVGIPLAYRLAIVDCFGIKGIWVGFATASLVQARG